MRIIVSLSVIMALAVAGCRTQLPLSERSQQQPQHESEAVDFGDALLNQRKILVMGPLDDRAAEATIQKLLYLEARSPQPIDLYIQTPGGEFKAAKAITYIMRNLRCPVNTYALSECNSGGAVLLAAGTGKRRAFKGAVIVVHGVKVRGNPPAKFTEEVMKAHDEFWRERAKLPQEWMPIAPGKEYVLSAEEALKYGIVDEILD